MKLRRAALAMFWLFLLLWTWLLVEPNPVPEPVHRLLSIYDWLPFLAAKSLHAGGYAFLTLLLMIWLPCRRPVQVFAISLLMAHGLGTEIIQTFVPNRTGLPRDVLIDWLGILLGVITSRIRFRPSPSSTSDSQN